ncbi:MAG TPA: DUF5977 domain-containing protein, partial [Methanosarcina sp.]|nr:DUF5977 domain-containing protein [Methanosarcina sp.]
FWIKKIQKIRDDMKLSCPLGGVNFCFHKVFVETNYRITSLPVELRTRIVKKYENGSTFEDITTMWYDGVHGFPTRIEYANSKRDTLTKHLQYPPDFLSNTSCQDMTTKNQISSAVEERLVKKTGNVELSKTEIVFNVISNSTDSKIYQPIEVKSSVGGFPTETELEFVYNPSGNVIQSRDKSGLTTSYIWAYNNRFPIAKIVGATKSQVEQYINPSTIINEQNSTVIESALTPLRNIGGAQVTTYTYMPGIGIASTTDMKGMRTTYEYDGNRRLVAIRDHNGSLISKFCYNYANQQVDCAENVVFTNYQLAYKNSESYSGQFTRACGSNEYGTTITYTVPAGTVVSYVSQADANAKAQQKMSLLGQAYANLNGYCNNQPATVFVVLSVENISVGGVSTFGDVVLRFYTDASRTVPVSVSNLNVRISEFLNNNLTNSGSSTEYAVGANGAVFVALPGVELSRNDGVALDWWKQFTLLPNPGYSF